MTTSAVNVFCPLASGSKGNCILLASAKTKILVDVGLSVKAITERLSALNITPDAIDGILITHEHIDHIRGIDVWVSRWQTPILANADTAKALLNLSKQRLPLKIFSTGEPFVFGDILVTPFSIQHDAADPVGFTFQIGSQKIGVCADLGIVTSSVMRQLQECDYLYIEANHEPAMVHASPRPAVYKQRVLSRQGHLSNEACAQLIRHIFHPSLKHIYLAHLSSECNSTELAFSYIQQQLQTLQAPATSLSIAWQDKISLNCVF